MPRLSRSTRPASALLLVGALALGLLSACSSSDASTRVAAEDGKPTTTAAQVTVPETVPAGTTLKIGDQLDYLKTVLAVSGQDEDLDYKLEFASFVGGPPMLQAFQGGSVDAGFVASTPLIFAQSAGQEIAAVAGWAPERGLGGLLSADDSIHSWKDLKGKKVAYQRGTSAEAAVLSGLDEAGLTLDDITTVDVPITQINATLAGGSADAGFTTEPLISLYLQDHPEGTLAIDGKNITDRASFLIASKKTLADDAKTAALADFTTRLVKAFAYLGEHQGDLADAVFVKQYGLTKERATELVESGNGSTTFFPLPGDILEPQQKVADLFTAAGQIPGKIDVAQEFDGRFNDIVAEAQKAEGIVTDTLETTPTHRLAEAPASAPDTVAPPAAAPGAPTELEALRTGLSDEAVQKRWGIPIGVERLLGVVVVLVGWALATNLGWISTKTLPKPGTVFAVGIDLWRDGTLQEALLASVQRVGWGLAIGVTIGTALALIVGLSRLGDDLIDTNISAFRFVPIIALQPLLVVWLGVGETVKITMIVLGVAFPIYINTTTAIKSLNPGYRELANVVGLSKRQLVRKIVLPGALPGFLVGLRMSVAISWLLLVFAETINASSGLGKMMSDASLFAHTNVLILGLILYAVLGLLTDSGVRLLERRLLGWQPGR